jgi:putative ABC transport system permease protein
MLKNYFLVAWRNTVRHKGLSFINIFGLSVGIACFSLIMLYALNELSFDRWHKNAPDIYRVYTLDAEDQSGWPYNPVPLGPEMKRRLPDVVDEVRFFEDDESKFVRAGEKVVSDRVDFADPQLLTVFSFRLKTGNPATALHDPHGVVLTESMAKKLFGPVSPLGKTLEIKLDQEFVPFTVTAVAEDLPPNSDIRFSILGNLKYLVGSSWGAQRATDWGEEDVQTYVLLKPGSGLPHRSAQLAAFRKQYYPDEDAEYRKKGYTGNGPRLRYGLQPLPGMHTDTRITRNQVPPVDQRVIWTVLAIATGILLIACANFTTLAIGRSAARAREVGIRKVIGGSRRALIFQFLSDALILTFFAAILGFLLARLLLPFLNDLSGRSLDFSLARYPQMSWVMAAVILVTGLLSGAYPAFVLAKFRPVEVLKQKVRVGGANWLTKLLVTVQFIIAAGLIVSTVIIIQQLHHLQSQNPGFNKENIVVIDAAGTDADQLYPLFKQGLSGNASIAGVARANLGLGQGMGYDRSGFSYEGEDKMIFYYTVDPDYLPVMGMRLVAGRNFDPAIASDSTTGRKMSHRKCSPNSSAKGKTNSLSGSDRETPPSHWRRSGRSGTS